MSFIPDNQTSGDSRVIVEKKLKEPDRYRVLLHNDDYTSMPLEGFRLPARSARKLRLHPFELTHNAAFGLVIRACAAPRDKEGGTWIIDDMSWPRWKTAGPSCALPIRPPCAWAASCWTASPKKATAVRCTVWTTSFLWKSGAILWSVCAAHAGRDQGYLVLFCRLFCLDEISGLNIFCTDQSKVF